MIRCFWLLWLGVMSFAVGAEPIRLHPENPHYFLFEGKPTVLVTSAEHYGAVLNLDFDYDRYLDTMAAEGMNYTRIFTGSYFEKPGAFGIQKNTLAPLPNRVITPWSRSNEPGYANGGNKFDLGTWNPDYFVRLHDFIAKAQERGIVVEVTLFSSIYADSNWGLLPLNPINNINKTSEVHRKFVHTLKNGNLLRHQENLVRKIVRELNGYDNVFYEIQNEPYADLKRIASFINPFDAESEIEWKRRVDLAPQESLEWQSRIASFIVEEEASLPKKHLLAQNYCNFKYPLKDVDEVISIINFHYAWPEAVAWNYGYDRVIGFDESGFIGKEDAVYRRLAWNFMLAGGGLFNGLDYSFTVDREDGTDTNNAPGGGGRALRAQLRCLHDFLDRFDFIAMSPKNFVVKKAPGVYTQCLASETQAAIYVNGDERCELLLSLPDGGYQVEWMSPETGAVLKIETVQVTGGEVQLVSPPYSTDIAVGLWKK